MEGRTEQCPPGDMRKTVSSYFLGEQGNQERATNEKLHQMGLQIHFFRFSWISQLHSGKGNGTEVKRMNFLLF